MFKQNKAFTLVELIVVIAILAILGTIAFISLQGYSKDTRNSVRLSDLSNINKTLGIQMVTLGKVPLPDNYIEITASGTVLNYQGEAGEKVLEILGVFNGGKDPKDDTYYTYSTNTIRTKYQLLGFLEGEAIAGLLPKTFAITDLSERQIKIYGNELGIILDSITNIPVKIPVDIINTNETYKTTFTEDITVEGTGGVLFSYFYNRNNILLDDKELAKLDENLVGYWDMETTTLSGATIILKDLSKFGNNGECYNSGVLVDCGGISGPQFLNNGMYFDGADDLIAIKSSESLNPEYITIFSIINLYGSGSNSNGYPRILSKGGINNSEEYSLWYTNKNDNLNINTFGLRMDTSLGGDNASSKNTYLPIYNKVVNVNLVYNGLSTKIYVDGLLFDNNVDEFKGTLISSDEHLVLGGAGWESLNKRAFYGEIDEIRIYNRALSDDEIRSLYEANK